MLTKRKSIILAGPDHFDILDEMKKHLTALGFQVYVFFPNAKERFQYENINQRIHNFIRKTFFRDKKFKKNLMIEQHKKMLLTTLNKIENVDYALFIRPDLFFPSFIQLAKTKCKMIVGYQWDGLDRYPEVYQYIQLMNRFFVFDETDLSVNNTFPTTNFYFEDTRSLNEIKRGGQSVFYVGSYVKNRVDTISDINAKLNDLHIHRDIRVISYDQDAIRHVITKGLTPRSEIITYKENLNSVINASILLDIQNDIHKGLSFRIFEGIGYEKKVITTNPDIIRYDFYHPNNFLVWNGQSTQELASFIKLPYHVLEDNIKRKYSFTNWIAYMLDMPIDYIPISLPR